LATVTRYGCMCVSNGGLRPRRNQLGRNGWIVPDGPDIADSGSQTACARRVVVTGDIP